MVPWQGFVSIPLSDRKKIRGDVGYDDVIEMTGKDLLSVVEDYLNKVISDYRGVEYKYIRMQEIYNTNNDWEEITKKEFKKAQRSHGTTWHRFTQEEYDYENNITNKSGVRLSYARKELDKRIMLAENYSKSENFISIPRLVVEDIVAYLLEQGYDAYIKSYHGIDIRLDPEWVFDWETYKIDDDRRQEDRRLQMDLHTLEMQTKINELKNK